jgi:hypothetical protein
VSAEVDGAAGAVLLADGPVLLEGGGTLNGRLVGAGGLEESVGAAVDLGSADGGGGGGRVVGTEGLNDVELDQRALGPAVEGEVPVAGCLESLSARCLRRCDIVSFVHIPQCQPGR